MAKTFHLAILETDVTPTSISDVEGTFADGVERFVRCGLNKAQAPIPEVRITKWNVVERQSYPTLEDVDGLFLTAGSMTLRSLLKYIVCQLTLIIGYSAYDDHPWAFPLMDFLKKAYENEIPILSICYGLQILTRALGGRVTKNPKGSELSITAVDLTPEGVDLFGAKSLVSFCRNKYKWMYKAHGLPTEYPSNASRCCG
jgi:GMP synthase-like glutamine amidotransferase